MTSRLPYASPSLPERWRWVRPATYVALALLFLLLTYQFQRGTHKYLRRAAEAQAAGQAETVKPFKGAVGRWRLDVRAFWRGENIYLAPLPPGQERPRPLDGWQAKHPNVPFVVLLLTPFAYLTAPWAAITWNVLKLGALVATVLMTVRIINHREHRMPDYVALLGFLAAIEFFIGDFQHGNTNVFVAAAIVGHLWAFRRGQDLLSGGFLALAICLKLTPALLLLYWVWQREWKVLVATAVALPVLLLCPVPFTGWSFFALSISTWWQELIYPGLVGGSWYPANVNQSLPAIVGRYFTSGDSGNYLWAPDSDPVPVEFAWITLVDLGPAVARRIVQVLQVILIVTSLWAIGWTRLSRDDGRRALHWGIFIALMMLLNQRTWDHHAPPLIVAHAAIVYAFFFAAALWRWRKRVGLVLLASVVLVILSSGDILSTLFGEAGADRIAAYGTVFWHFLIVWVLAVMIAVPLKRLPEPYLVTAQVIAPPDEEFNPPPTPVAVA